MFSGFQEPEGCWESMDSLGIRNSGSLARGGRIRGTVLRLAPQVRTTFYEIWLRGLPLPSSGACGVPTAR